MAIIFSIIDALIYTTYGYCVGIFIFNNKRKLSIYLLMNYSICLLIYYFLFFIINPMYSLFFSCIILIPLLKSLFNEKTIKVIILSYSSNIILLLFKYILLLPLNYDKLNLVTDFNNYNKFNFLLNIVSVLLTINFIFVYKDKIKKIINKIDITKYKWLFLILLLVINVLLSIFISFDTLEINKYSFVNYLVITIIIVLLMYLIYGNNKIDSLSTCYNEISEYAKLSEELNLDYRCKLHENRNQLILIDGMVSSNDIKLKKYITYLIGQASNVDNSHLSELSYIPFPGIKSFISSKLNELYNLGAIVEVFVSEEIKNIDFYDLNEKDYNDMTITLGVILDNIIDSIKKQNEKLVSISIFLEDEKFHFQCANTFDGNIDIDKIFKRGYSTNGSNRGVGLSIVKEVMSNSNILDCKSSVIDNFFMQDITIVVPKIIK